MPTASVKNTFSSRTKRWNVTGVPSGTTLPLASRIGLVRTRTVSPAAIASLANHAVLKSYGVVGMSSRNLTQLLNRDSKRGVRVHLEDGEIVIELYVIVEYGTRISEVAHNIVENVYSPSSLSLNLSRLPATLGQKR